MPVENRILVKMLDRLFAGLVNRPSLNCRPHSSRQRVDWTLLAKFKDLSPEEAFRKLLSEEKSVKLVAKAPFPKRLEERSDERLSSEELGIKRAWSDQQSLLAKLRGITEDANV